MAENEFAVAALFGAFADEARFECPLGTHASFVIRREGTNALQKLSIERAKKDKLRSILAQGFFENRAKVMELASKAGYSAPEVIAALGDFYVDEAINRLVTWEGVGKEFNAGNAREFLTLDGVLTQDEIPEALWEILESEKREQWEAIQEALPEADREGKAFKMTKEWSIGGIYCTWIRYCSKQTARFRSKVIGEAAKN